MATKKDKPYSQQAITASIKFTSRASVAIKTKTGNTNYYTVEACEERLIPAIEGVDIAKERQLLWDAVNNECDLQIQEIVDIYGEKK